MASAPPPEVKQGSKGQWVRNAQALLVAHGNSLAVDGVFGPQTTHVVKQWQARTGVLRADGVIGPKTWQWLTGIPLQGGAP